MANQTDMRPSKAKSPSQLLAQRKKQLFKLAEKLEECHGVSIMLFTCIPQEKLIENAGYGSVGKELLSSGKGKDICRVWESYCHETYRIFQHNSNIVESLPKRVCYPHKGKMKANLGVRKNLVRNAVSKIGEGPMSCETAAEVHPRTPVSIEMEACKTLGKRFQDLCSELSVGNLPKRIRLESSSPEITTLNKVQLTDELSEICEYSSVAPPSLQKETVSISIEKSIPLVLEWNFESEFPERNGELCSINAEQNPQHISTQVFDAPVSLRLRNDLETQEASISSLQPSGTQMAKSIGRCNNTIIDNETNSSVNVSTSNGVPKEKDIPILNRKQNVKINSRRSHDVNTHNGSQHACVSTAGSEVVSNISKLETCVESAITAVKVLSNTNSGPFKCESSMPTTSGSNNSGDLQFYKESCRQTTSCNRIERVMPRRNPGEVWSARAGFNSTKQLSVATDVRFKPVTYASSCPNSLIFQNPASLFLPTPSIVESFVGRGPSKSTNRYIQKVPSFPWFPNPFLKDSRDQEMTFSLPWRQFPIMPSARPNRVPALLPAIEEIDNSDPFVASKRSSSSLQPSERRLGCAGPSCNQESLLFSALTEVRTPFGHLSLQPQPTSHNVISPRVESINALDLSMQK